MQRKVSPEHILIRVWIVCCFLMLLYQCWDLNQFIKNTSYQVQDKITIAATKILNDMYLDKFGMTAQEYQYLQIREAMSNCVQEHIDKNYEPTKQKENAYFSVESINRTIKSNLKEQGYRICQQRNLDIESSGISISRLRLKMLSLRIKTMIWMKAGIFSFVKNMAIFIAFSLISFGLIRIFPIWLIKGQISFKNDIQQFPVDFFNKIWKKFR